MASVDHDGCHARARGLVQIRRAQRTPIDPNKLNHLFGKAEHDLGGVLKSFGGDQARAYHAIDSKTQKLVRMKKIDGVFEEEIVVAGEKITVRGNVIDGKARIGTVFKPPP